MKENKSVFCEICRKDFDQCEVAFIEMTGKIKGKTYTYEGKEARCPECGELVYVPEVNDYNLAALYDVYRKENNIISCEIISKIPVKYNIGKRPLSLLLGWGELTLTRYCDGDIPSKQYSDILFKIYNEPEYYNEILESNKDNISSIAYEKSKQAVGSLLGINLQTTKIHQIIEYILHVCGDITPLALQKILYYAQGFHYAFYNSFLFTNDCEAWAHGPVYREIYIKYKDYHYDPIEKKDCTYNVDFNFIHSEKAILDSVIKYFSCYSGKVLEQFTHSEKPWMDTRENVPVDSWSNKVIKKETIGTYFSDVKKRFDMINPTDIGKYAQYMFLNV